LGWRGISFIAMMSPVSLFIAVYTFPKWPCPKKGRFINTVSTRTEDFLSGMFIPDPDFFPPPGSKIQRLKSPGSLGSATLEKKSGVFLFLGKNSGC
jgi:hypothetical protein